MTFYDDTNPQTADADESPTRTNNPLLHPSNPLVSDLEQEVLDEYARLLDNVNKLASALDTLSANPCSMTLDGLRLLERKTATVCTLLKASVYSIVLQQQIYNDDNNGNNQGQGEGEGKEQQQYQYQEGGYGGYEAGDVTAIQH
ncbi:hypothetical protein VTN00DRAFT_9859 [Thermoascus crustaceus]|uniref:uncharacterized protein n=1 Tax=Thermoascus crustaceus TaxID=5088 RepID=UPI0037428538